MYRSGQRFWIVSVILGLIFSYKNELLESVMKEVTEVTAHVTSGEEIKIALTFDDGPHPIYTPKLLEGLKERDVKATFFVTGANAELYPELIERMQEDGHIIGNHTYHHVSLSAIGEELFIQELKETNRVLEGILGAEVEYVRPPFGDWKKTIEQEINLFPVMWDVDPLDWCTGNSSLIVKRVLGDVRENAIILMHDEYDASIEATFDIIDTLQTQGYEFVTVDQILLH
jgi:peptidoglycan/xylan/chitin deacetylase (PgdA/CDA1 family)